VLEASRVLAQQLLGEQSTVEEKINKAFRLIICRQPSAAEQKILKVYYDEQLQLFQQNKLNAAVTLKVGEYPLNKQLNAQQLAAIMKTINTIYNVEEAIVK
jgi:hypothetical protein